MNQLFSFHKELNTKKIILLIVIILIMIISIIFIIFKHSNIGNLIKKNDDTLPYNTFSDANNLISISLSKEYKLYQVQDDNYLLSLKSDNNLDIFISYENLLEGRNLESIVNADLRSYLENFNNYTNLSNIKEYSLNGHSSYNYSFEYLDSDLNKSFYLQVTWIETENGYYVVDIEFPVNELNHYSNIINETIDSLQTNF